MSDIFEKSNNKTKTNNNTLQINQTLMHILMGTVLTSDHRTKSGSSNLKIYSHFLKFISEIRLLYIFFNTHLNFFVFWLNILLNYSKERQGQ